MITKFYNRRRSKHPILIDDELAMLQRVNVTLDQE